MMRLTPDGEKLISEIAQRYALSVDAVKAMLEAVWQGGGAMAQFYSPELGGGGQWMRGGMTMVGDMFNHSLKATVDNLCSELSDLISREPRIFPATGQWQNQSQGGSSSFSSPQGGPSIFVPEPPQASWWPSELGMPSSTGAQNAMRYAYFPDKRRLAIDLGGKVEVYDTLDHMIGGFGQQQSGGASITFTSQYGTVALNTLPRAGGSATPPAPQAAAPSTAGPAEQTAAPPSRDDAADSHAIIATIEKLGDLCKKGLLTEQEFAAKKAELLSRL